jgi:hypothetical protein
MTRNGQFDHEVAPDSTMAIFCSNLSLGLHAAAQPLTVLQASLDNSLTNRMSKSDLKRLVEESALEVKRVCSLFSQLQELVTIERIGPELFETHIVPVLAEVTAGAIWLFEESAMVLSSVVQDIRQPVLMDRARTLQVLSSVLLVAHGMACPRDTVEMIACENSADTVQVVVRNLNSRFEVMDAEKRMCMVLAEASIRSQKGKLSWSLNPFNVQIELERAPLTN